MMLNGLQAGFQAPQKWRVAQIIGFFKQCATAIQFNVGYCVVPGFIQLADTIPS